MGPPMGQVIELDNMRLNRSGQRFVHALYFSGMGTPLPVEARVRVGAKMDLRAKDADTITIARALKTLPGWRDGSVGTVFSYLGAIEPKCGTADCRDLNAHARPKYASVNPGLRK